MRIFKPTVEQIIHTLKTSEFALASIGDMSYLTDIERDMIEPHIVCHRLKYPLDPFRYFQENLCMEIMYDPEI